MSNIINKAKPYRNSDSIEKLVKYCTNQDGYIGCYFFGVNPLTYGTAINSMHQLKRRFNKENGKQLYHLIFTIYKKTLYSSDFKEAYLRHVTMHIGNKLLEMGFQSIGFMHNNCYENVHVHFIINSVRFDGYKLYNINSIGYEFINELNNEFPALHWEYYYPKG